LGNKTNKKVLHIPANAPDIPQNWSWYRLDEICKGIFDCPHSSPKLTPEGAYIVRSQDIRSGVFRLEEAGRVSEETYSERISRAEPRYGDLLYSREGTYFGIAAEVPQKIKVCLGQRMVLIRPDPCRLHFRFLRYWLNSPILAAHIYGHRDGTVAERLNLPTIRGLPVPLPPMDEQKKIAHILGTLDDKIELNQQMNRTLEGITRALFKSWFIDFDPVRAKLDGRQPAGMDAETAALFPDSFEDSPLGKIPKGWRVGRLDDLVVLQRGFDLPKRDRQSGKYPILAASGPSGTHCEYKVKGPGVTTGRSGVLGNVFFVHEDFWPLNTSLWVKEFKESRPIHAYHLLRDLNFEIFNAGSAVPTLNRNHVHGLKVVVPPLPVVEAFELLTTPVFQKRKANDKESIEVAALRDVLLPKLLSGEICVKDTEQAMEAVA
jgi:type I restriction enzyme S subunit